MQNIILVTGAAGFIGSALVKRLLKNEEFVIGLDNINDYYDKSLKRARLSSISEVEKKEKGKWLFFEESIENKDFLDSLRKKYKFNIVINFAAQAGVRYSIKNPEVYIQSNLVGFANILEFCRDCQIQNFIYASSSSVYGGYKNYPFQESDSVDHPVSLYAATKKANEAMAHSYSHLFNIPTTGLRFFTVYGPWGRPDMAPMIFAKSILANETINIFNNGEMFRDFTYIDDIVEGAFLCCYKPAKVNEKFDLKNPDPATSFAPHRIFNIGNNKPVKLLRFIDILENKLGIKAKKNFAPMQPGDVRYTYADTSKLNDWISYIPKTNIEEGVEKFANWYLDYYL